MAATVSPAHTIASRVNTDAMQAGMSTVLIPKFAAISSSGTGDTTVVTGTAGKQIRVVTYNFIVSGATVVTWKSSVAGAISGAQSFAANGGKVVPYCPVGTMQTAVGEDLVINSSQNVTIGGELTYINV